MSLGNCELGYYRLCPIDQLTYCYYAAYRS